VPCDKGKDSINLGIDLLKQYQFRVTSRSTNLIKELRNYVWKDDIKGYASNIPIDRFNHGIDAMRYVSSHFLKTKHTFKPLKIVK